MQRDSRLTALTRLTKRSLLVVRFAVSLPARFSREYSIHQGRTSFCLNAGELRECLISIALAIPSPLCRTRFRSLILCSCLASLSWIVLSCSAMHSFRASVCPDMVAGKKERLEKSRCIIACFRAASNLLQGAAAPPGQAATPVNMTCDACGNRSEVVPRKSPPCEGLHVKA